MDKGFQRNSRKLDGKVERWGHVFLVFLGFSGSVKEKTAVRAMQEISLLQWREQSQNPPTKICPNGEFRILFKSDLPLLFETNSNSERFNFGPSFKFFPKDFKNWRIVGESGDFKSWYAVLV